MPDFENFQDLEDFLNEQIAESLQSDVFPYVKQVIQAYIDEDVYSYTPKKYVRTGELRRNIVFNLSFVSEEWLLDVSDNTFHDGVNPMRTDVYVPEVIEYGEWKSSIGYEFVPRGGDTGKYPYLLPRPFMEDSWNLLNQSGAHVRVLADGLKQWVDVQIL